MSLYGKTKKEEPKSLLTKNLVNNSEKKIVNSQSLNNSQKSNFDILFIASLIHFIAILFPVYILLDLVWISYPERTLTTELIQIPSLILLAISVVISLKTKNSFITIGSVLFQLIALFVINLEFKGDESILWMYFRDYFNLDFRSAPYVVYFYYLENDQSKFELYYYIQKVVANSWLSIALFLSTLSLFQKIFKKSLQLISLLLFVSLTIVASFYLITEYKVPVTTSLTNNRSEVSYTNVHKSYDLERDRLISGNEWSQINMPRINNWEFKYSEVMVCDEGTCIAFWRSVSNKDKILKLFIISCPNNYDEQNNYCGSSRIERLVIESNNIINNQDFNEFYKMAKARFE